MQGAGGGQGQSDHAVGVVAALWQSGRRTVERNPGRASPRGGMAGRHAGLAATVA
ncbi:hypothetical protein K788_0000854 [Paraburkholderia caribensis MBA4]|uniref:Uncharacterized protein n=1 Tax=Paraburkholderia caribensis MBA4 TaxID=1323664 RepID=A0A0P0RH75_9BURK|nr:hypothetical protein K788_0000854 [Paraburkholderia caribensis MBA4]